MNNYRGTPDCTQSQSVTMVSGNIYQFDFFLDPGSVVSGTVYDKKGIPITSGEVSISTGDPCGTYKSISKGSILPNGYYIIRNLPSGNYHLSVNTPNSRPVEWWSSLGSSSDCTQSQQITLTTGQTVTDKDFQIKQFRTGSLIFPVMSKDGKLSIITM